MVVFVTYMDIATVMHEQQPKNISGGFWDVEYHVSELYIPPAET
jgi:hypothetical protein